MKQNRLMHLRVSLFLGLYLLLSTTLTAGADGLSDVMRKSIENTFPECEIKETEEEMWKGEAVIEVELITKDGIPYEVYISKDGQIVKAAKEGESSWIAGELSIGLAVTLERDIYKGVSSEIEPTPFLRYEYGPFEIQGTDSIDATFKLYETNGFSIAVLGSLLQEEGYDVDDSDYLKGMDALKSTFFHAGLELEGQYAGLETSLEVSQNTTGGHDGQEVELAFEYPWMAAGFEFRPSIGMAWKSKKMVDYFYGVSAKEAKVDRPVYSPGSSYEIEAELMVMRPIFGNFTAVGIAGISTFGKDITDSPLVDKDYEASGIFGVMYTF